MALTDAQAKARLRAWPTNTKTWSLKGGPNWLRAQPAAGNGVASPRLQLPGTDAFRTQPDGMWFTLGGAASAAFVDCIVVESCGTAQNLNDKRSRYAARTTSFMVKIPGPWLAGTESVQTGAIRTRAQLLGGGLAATEISLPVRHLRVLYAVPNDGQPSLYSRVMADMVLEAHEYVCPQGVLGWWTNQGMQKFLKRMAPALSFYA